MTGLTERAAKQEGYDYLVSVVHPADHVTLIPGASTLHMKLVTDRQTNKILGCQVVGEHGVDKRCDVIATAIHAGMTAEDLTNLDLCYAPQFEYLFLSVLFCSVLFCSVLFFGEPDSNSLI